ncbi:hypothetical protein ASZ78_015986, partial [Callipepla squamata]
NCKIYAEIVFPSTARDGEVLTLTFQWKGTFGSTRGFLAIESISPNERKLRKTKLPKIKKENSVLLLRKSNFDRALKETKYLLVEFCEYQLCLSYPGSSAEHR